MELYVGHTQYVQVPKLSPLVLFAAMSNIDHNFLFASLRSTQPLTTRRVHIRRLYDVLQLCIHRQDYARARCAWAILIRCREIEWKFLWTIGLLLVDGLDPADVSEGRVDYLRSLMLQHLEQVGILDRSSPNSSYFKARSFTHRVNTLSYRNGKI